MACGFSSKASCSLQSQKLKAGKWCLPPLSTCLHSTLGSFQQANYIPSLARKILPWTSIQLVQEMQNGWCNQLKNHLDAFSSRWFSSRIHDLMNTKGTMRNMYIVQLLRRNKWNEAIPRQEGVACWCQSSWHLCWFYHLQPPKQGHRNWKHQLFLRVGHAVLVLVPCSPCHTCNPLFHIIHGLQLLAIMSGLYAKKASRTEGQEFKTKIYAKHENKNRSRAYTDAMSLNLTSPAS